MFILGIIFGVMFYPLADGFISLYLTFIEMLKSKLNKIIVGKEIKDKKIIGFTVEENEDDI